MAIIYNNMNLCSFLLLPVLWKVITFKPIRPGKSTIKYSFSYLPLYLILQLKQMSCNHLWVSRTWIWSPFQFYSSFHPFLGTNFFEVNIPLPCWPVVGDLSSPLVLTIIVFTWCSSLLSSLSFPLQKEDQWFFSSLVSYLGDQVRVRVFSLIAACDSRADSPGWAKITHSSTSSWPERVAALSGPKELQGLQQKYTSEHSISEVILL